MQRHANGVRTALLLVLLSGLILLAGRWLGGSQGLTIAFATGRTLVAWATLSGS